MPKQHENSKPRPLTYRVQEIPFNWGKKKLKAAFCEADRPYVTVKSLVPDVMNYHNNDGTDTLTATVLFSPPEPREPSLLIKWKAELELDRDFGGFTPLNDPKDDVSGDIIAVTGLAGHAFGSWANGPDRMWLRDFLPSTISNARVLVYGYRTPLQGIEQPKSILTEHADSFMNDLLTIRHNPACQDRPLVLIGHSLGGLIIKEFIVSLEEEVRCRLPIRSLVFFGVPHLGLETNGTLASMVNGQPSQTLVHELNRDSPTIIALTKQFTRVLRDAPFIVHSLYESQPTKTVIRNNAGQWVREGEPVVMVPHSSAILRHDKEKHAISVAGDHSSMVKLKKGQGSCYPSVSQWIKEDLKNATEVFNGLHSKVQASVKEHMNQNDPGRKPSMNLPLLGTRRDKFQTPPPPAKENKHGFQVPKQSTPSSSDNASGSEEESSSSDNASDSEEEPARQGAKDYDNKRKSTPIQTTQDTSRSLCMVIHNKVYDCSSFVDDHPGGEDVLLDVAGEDATEAFEDVGHSDEAREILDGLYIRDLIRLTPVEVMKHDTRRDLYVIIHNKVYDLTCFVEEHPGGEDVLLDVAGCDATEAFEDVGHSDDAREILGTFYRGDLEKTSNP